MEESYCFAMLFHGYFVSKFHMFLDGSFGICKVNSVYYLLSVVCFLDLKIKYGAQVSSHPSE